VLPLNVTDNLLPLRNSVEWFLQTLVVSQYTPLDLFPVPWQYLAGSHIMIPRQTARLYRRSTVNFRHVLTS